ncbi:MAG: chorismate-binding protein [Bacteroidales bacterium]
MKKYYFNVLQKKVLADTITPVSLYLKFRDIFPRSILLESSDYHGNRDSFSFLCLNPVAGITVDQGQVQSWYPDGSKVSEAVGESPLADKLNAFIRQFVPNRMDVPANGLFGYITFDAIQLFENISFSHTPSGSDAIPALSYSFYKYIIAINHFQNTLYLIENLFDGELSQLGYLESLLNNRNIASYRFHSEQEESSNLTDSQFMELVTHGKDHCFRGDVFQIVLSRQFSRPFTGDEFNVYRALRSVNPSPYLYYFDFGGYRIFGSSPEAQLEIRNNTVNIYPIAGTFRRTGNDEQDKKLAEELALDPKENAEHVMLVDLARNDLSRNASQVIVETYREIQFYSHVLHMVSKVSGKIKPETNRIQVLADSFPAGTLSGAPKYKAMELIDRYENKSRGYYGGCIGYLGFNGDVNHAIMIRSFLSKENHLFYQAGAGIVSASVEQTELQEVNNKLAALKTAINMAKEM